MTDQKPITWTNPNGRRHWWRALRRMRLRPSVRIRSESLMLVATCFAAIAAGLSVWAALRQERATYDSQLYDRQPDAIVAFSSAVTVALDDSKALLEEIERAAHATAIPGSNVRERTEKQIADMKRAIGTFSLVFPLDEFPPLEGALREALDENRMFLNSLEHSSNHAYVDFGTPTETAVHFSNTYRKAAQCVGPPLRILIECAKQDIRTGHPVSATSAHLCAKSLSPAPEQIKASDAADCMLYSSYSHAP